MKLITAEGEGPELVDVVEPHDLDQAPVEVSRIGVVLRRRTPSQRKMMVAAAWLAGGVALLVLFELASFHIVTISPDGSTVLLEGQALSGGNLTLHGWLLALDSFWTIDAPFYAVGVWIFGVTPLLLNLVPAAIAALVVLASLRIASDGRVGDARVVAMVSVLALLAVPGPDLADYLLQGPWHIATALWCLLAFFGASRHRFGWPWALAVVMLAAGLLGDLMILVIGVIPVLFAGLVYMRRVRNWRAGLPAFSAGVAGIVVAVVVRELTDLIGTFRLTDRNLALQASQMMANLRQSPGRFASLLGVGSMRLKGISNGPAALQGVHVIAVAVVVLVVLAAALALIRGLLGRAGGVSVNEERHLDDFFLLGLIADFGFYAGASQTGNLEFVKYLTPGVIFAAVLVGRATGRLVPRLRAKRIWHLLLAAGLSVCVVFAVDFGIELGRAVPARPAYAVAQFLRAHDLGNGVGDYWSSSLVTVEADGAIAVRPVTTLAGKIVQFDRQMNTDWYRDTTFDYLVFDTARPWHGVNATSAIATFGAPSHVYSVGSYRVMTWKSGIRVIGSLPPSGAPLRISISRPPVISNGRLVQR